MAVGIWAHEDSAEYQPWTPDASPWVKYGKRAQQNVPDRLRDLLELMFDD